MESYSAATNFASLPELVRCLAEQVRSRKELARLRLVSKAFNAVITPFLFREVFLGSRKKELQYRTLYLFSKCNYLGHVKDFCLMEGSLRNDDEYHHKVQTMLPKMPLLETFRWLGIALAVTTPHVLHDSCPKLKAIHIEFPVNMGRNIGYSVFTQDDYWWEPARELYGKPDLTLFSNLEELSLENLYEELPWWRSQIVQILKNSPGLNDLRLSLSSETMAHYFQDDEDEMYRGFFDRLCDEYHETGAPPLRLQSLYLGAGTAPLNTASLQKLTDPSFLENLHIENTDHWSQGEVLTYNDGTTPIAWASFGPTHCPNLRSLTAGNYLPDIHVFLASVDNPSFLRRLALFTVKCEAETATLLRPLTRYPALPMRPRMVEVDLDRGAPSPVEGESEDALEDELVVPSAELVLEHLVSGDDGALEGLILGIPVVVHGEVNLSFVNLSLAAVAKLVNLTQLAVYVSRPDPVALSELEEVARRFAAAAPSLRYVAVLAGSLAYAYWRVWRSSDGTVELGVLEGREVRDVELFRFMMWEQSDYVRCEVNHRYLPYRRMSWLMSRPRHSMHR